jgi:hypothetical protein
MITSWSSSIIEVAGIPSADRYLGADDGFYREKLQQGYIEIYIRSLKNGKIEICARDGRIVNVYFRK